MIINKRSVEYNGFTINASYDDYSDAMADYEIIDNRTEELIKVDAGFRTIEIAIEEAKQHIEDVKHGRQTTPRDDWA